MSASNYSNDKIAASWLLIDDIKEGCDGEGDWFVGGGRDNPARTSQSDRAGNTTQIHDARKQGTFVLNVLRSSTLFSLLRTIFEADDAGVDQVGVFKVTDLEKNETTIYHNARISDWPGESFGPTVQVFPVPFIYERAASPAAVIANVILGG